MRIAIIGAGVAGLCSGRHCKTENHQFDIFEQTTNVGGIWNYTDRVGVDEYGVKIHTSMYRGLRTNLPKELMELEDFRYPELDRSFVSQDIVLKYLQDYTKHFDLQPHLKFLKQVTKVEHHNNKWLVTINDVKTKNMEVLEYDSVMICNGHYADKFMAKVEGIESFSGVYKHSHDYRGPDDSYKNKRILLLGAGPSGTDISNQLTQIADKVILSFRPKETYSPISNKVVVKPLVKELKESEAIFVDGSREIVDEIIFCTGYNYSFPFLTESCKIKVDNNYVNPLYKQVINIEHPTMAFIGLLTMICPFPECDIQVRFFLSTLNGHFRLPSKEDMLEELKTKIEQFGGKPSKSGHVIGAHQGEYFDELAETAKIKRIWPVISKLYLRVRMKRDLNDYYKILDEENYQQIH